MTQPDKPQPDDDQARTAPADATDRTENTQRGFSYGLVEDSSQPDATPNDDGPADAAGTPTAAPPTRSQAQPQPQDPTPARTPAPSAWDDPVPRHSAPPSRDNTAGDGRKPRPFVGLAAKSLPHGWPVGSFTTYEKAQQAVDLLSDTGDFPVREVAIVGCDLVEVERVVARLSWAKVIGRGALSGAWMGLFFGVLISLINDRLVAPIAMVLGMVLGIIFGIISAAVPYALTRGRRDFATNTQIVARRYDIVCSPEFAPRARDLIARAGI